MPSKKGFTLIEILVATTIIGIILSLSLVSLEGSKKASRDSQRKANLEQIRSALEMYKADKGYYPLQADPVWFNVIEGNDLVSNKLRTGGYLNANIVDPINNWVSPNSGPCLVINNYRYSYMATKSDDSLSCTEDTSVTGCAKYYLTAIMENMGSKDSSPCRGTKIDYYCHGNFQTVDFCYLAQNP